MLSLPITQDAWLSIHMGQFLSEGKERGWLVPALQTCTSTASLHHKTVSKEEEEVQGDVSSSSSSNLVYFQHLSYYGQSWLSSWYTFEEGISIE